jgi:hypothetical protein
VAVDFGVRAQSNQSWKSEGRASDKIGIAWFNASCDLEIRPKVMLTCFDVQVLKHLMRDGGVEATGLVGNVEWENPGLQLSDDEREERVKKTSGSVRHVI